MAFRLLALLLVPLCSGCMATALSKRSTNQTVTDMDIRYQQVVDNLAMTAHDPSALPVYSPLYAGTSQLQATRSIGGTTTLQALKPAGFVSQTLAPGVNRQLTEVWSVDPIVIPEKLEAMRAACQWVVYGQEFALSRSAGLLLNPDDFPQDSDRHFNVAARLAELPGRWLGVGRRHDVPHDVAYKAHFDDTWVWVTAENLQALADFALVIVDIARVDPNSPALFPAHPLISPITVASNINDPRQFWKATVFVNEAQQLTSDGPYVRFRMDNTLGNNAFLKTSITAAGLVPK